MEKREPAHSNRTCRGLKQLPGRDLNPDYLIQSQACYRYTTRQGWAAELSIVSHAPPSGKVNRASPNQRRLTGEADLLLRSSLIWLPEAYFPCNQRQASLAKYVRIMSAPARLMLVRISSAIRCSSIQPLAAAALTIANSPLTL